MAKPMADASKPHATACYIILPYTQHKTYSILEHSCMYRNAVSVEGHHSCPFTEGVPARSGQAHALAAWVLSQHACVPPCVASLSLGHVWGCVICWEHYRRAFCHADIEQML